MISAKIHHEVVLNGGSIQLTVVISSDDASENPQDVWEQMKEEVRDDPRRPLSLETGSWIIDFTGLP